MFFVLSKDSSSDVSLLANQDGNLAASNNVNHGPPCRKPSKGVHKAIRVRKFKHSAPSPKNLKTAKEIVSKQFTNLQKSTTRIRTLKRDLELGDRLFLLAATTKDDGSGNNLGYQVFLAIRDEIMFEDKDELNWDDVHSIGGNLFLLSGETQTIYEMENQYRAENGLNTYCFGTNNAEPHAE